MRYALAVVMAFCVAAPLLSQEKTEGPANEKAQKTFQDAIKDLSGHMIYAAVDDFKKADKQDGGRCLACQKNMIKYGMELADWKTAETAAQEMITEAAPGKEAAIAHYQFAVVLMDEAISKKKKRRTPGRTTNSPWRSQRPRIFHQRCFSMGARSRI